MPGGHIHNQSLGLTGSHLLESIRHHTMMVALNECRPHLLHEVNKVVLGLPAILQLAQMTSQLLQPIPSVFIQIIPMVQIGP